VIGRATRARIQTCKAAELAQEEQDAAQDAEGKAGDEAGER